MRSMILLALAALIVCGSCSKPPSSERSAPIVPPREITQVMDAHVKELMAIPGVIGVAVGALDDGTPCILVLVSKIDAGIHKSVPQEIEGHPVKIEVTGEIRPMSGDSAR
jgi:hypothetical protein